MILSILQAAEAESFSLIAMAAKGGWLMLVLLALSIVAIYIFAGKWWALRKACGKDKNFTKDLRDYLVEGKVRSARALCKRNDGPLARVLDKGIVRKDDSVAEMREAMDNLGNLEVGRLEKGLPILAAIAGGAPMIGFLGTVIGMVEAFYNMARAGSNVDISVLSGGIYTAMITTVGGLIVGILAYFGYNYLTSKISDLVFTMNCSASELAETVTELRKKAEESR